MEQRDYSADLPTRAPDGVLEWLMEQGAFRKQYLIYRVEYYHNPLTGEKVKGVKVTCTECGRSIICDYVHAGGCGMNYSPAPFGFFNPLTTEAVISGSCTICPECGAQAEAKHIGAIPTGILDEAWCMTVGRLEDKLVLYGWLFRRSIDKAARSEYWSMPYEAYVVEKKKIVRLMGYQKFMSTVTLFGHWVQRKQYMDNWGYAPAIYPWDPAILEGSTAENCKLDKYLKAAPKDECMPVTYLRLWQKHKNLENLVTRGAGRLLHEMIEQEGHHYSYGRVPGTPKLPDLNLKQARPAAMLGLNKTEFGFCVQQKWKLEDLRLYKLLRKIEKITLPEDMALVKKESRYGVESLAKRPSTRQGVTVMRCLRYLEKQRQRYPAKVDAGYLLDYWTMAECCGWNLADESLLLPKDLTRAHDKAMREDGERKAKNAAEKKAKEITAREPAFRKRAEELTPYAWEQGGLLIRPCENETELIREGEILHHCVGGYAGQVANGSTAIFFIRKSEEPDMPYYTLQLDESRLTVLQNRGSHNCDRTQAVKDFEAAWLNHLRAKKAAGELTPKKKQKKAKEEKVA